MKPLRYQLVEDAERHLKQDMIQVLQRHMGMMKAGGLATTEASAAVLGATEAMASIAVALTVFETAKPEARGEFIAEISARLGRKVNARADILLSLMAQADDIVSMFR